MMLQPSELLLQETIVKRNSALVIKYLDFFYENAGIRLSCVDADGKSFLHHALETGQKEVADRLLEKEINNTFLSEQDNSGQTCLFLAARQGYSDIVRILIDKNRETRPATSEDKIWLKPDAKGNAPLHAAVEKRHIATVQLLLEEISLETDAVNHINRINHSGDIPLHLAFSIESFLPDVGIAALLIQHGADLTLTNTKQQTPFSALLQLDFSEQMALFALLKQDVTKNDRRLFFLQIYRNYVIACPDDITMLRQYYQLTCSHSLKMYVGAKLEFDDMMDIRNFYRSTRRTTDRIEMVEKKIPHSIFKTIPIYKDKVHMAMRDILPEEISDTDEESFDQGSETTQERYQLLHQDQGTLLRLIKDMEAFINDVQARPGTNFFPGLKLALLISAILLLVYLVIEIPVAINAAGSNARAGKDLTFGQYSRNILPPVLFGALGFILWVFLSLCACCSIPLRPVNISQNEWKALIDQLRESILEKLQFLEQKELQDKLLHSEKEIHYLPVSVDTIRKFENTLMDFDSERKTITEMKDLLGRLDVVIKKIQKGLYRTNNPFSMFYTPSQYIVNIPETGSFEPVMEISDEDSSSSLEMRQALTG